MELAKYIDHTLLKPDATWPQVQRLCDEARQYGFASVCVNPVFIQGVAHALKDSGVAPCCVVGFPLGALPSDLKAQQAQGVVRLGAREIDMVVALGAVKERRFSDVERDIALVVRAAGDALVKVILETCLLSDEEKALACQAAKAAGAAFVKTSTGFGPGGATEADVALMRRVVGDGMGVKASGGIRSREAALRMIDAGANRIGTSAGVKIVTES